MLVLDSTRFRRRRHLVLGGVAAFVVFTLVAPSDSRLGTAVNDLAQLVAAGLAAEACRRAAKASKGAVRRSWTAFAAGCAAWALGQLVWTVYEVVLGEEVPFPSFADAGFLLFVPLTFEAFLPLIDTPAARLSRTRAALEALIIAGGLFFISWVTILRSLVEEGSGSTLEQWLAVAYPVGDLLVLSAALFAATRRSAARRGVIGLLAAGIAAISISDSAFLYLTATDTYGGTQWLDTGWVAGFLVIALAACRPAPTRERPIGRTRAIVLLTFPFLPIGAAATIAAILAGNGRTLDRVALYESIGVILVLVVHQIWVTIENHSITDSLAQRVDERTTELAHTERYFRQVVEKSTDVVMVLGRHLVVRDVTASMEHVFGISPATVRGRPVAHLFPDDDAAELHAAIARASTEPDGVATAVWTLTDGSGRRRHAQTGITNLLDDPAVSGIVLNTRDITPRTHCGTRRSTIRSPSCRTARCSWTVPHTRSCAAAVPPRRPRPCSSTSTTSRP